MSSNHTPNYGLSQWERSDKVLMDDFNADNAKIDAAFCNHPSAELIQTVTVEDENTSTVPLDVSQVDWSRYLMLYLSLQKEGKSTVDITTNHGSGHCMRLYNGGENNSNYMAYFYESTQVRAFFFVGYSGETAPVLLGVSTCPVTGTTFHEYFSVVLGTVEVPYQGLSKFLVGSKFGANAKIELWGIK